MIIFKSEIDRNGRFGHQFYRIFTSILLAEYFDGLFIEPLFKYFAYKTNDYLSFSRHPRCALQLPSCTYLNYSGGQVDVYGNDKLDLCNPQVYTQFIQNLEDLKNLGKSVLINLPYDQEPGQLMNLYYTNSGVQKNLVSMLNNRPKTATNCLKRIVIHIRRGDVSPQRFPSWYIEDKVYLCLIRILCNSQSDIRLDVITQGNLSFYNQISDMSMVRIYSSSNNLNHQDEIRDLEILSNASLIIGGQSTFSQIPSLINNIPFIELIKAQGAQHQPHMFKPSFSISTDMILQQPNKVLDSINILLKKL